MISPIIVEKKVEVTFNDETLPVEVIILEPRSDKKKVDLA
jgi:hypothetical protein